MTRIALAAREDGAAGPARLALRPGLLQPRTLARGTRHARVALVAGGAMLLGGDAVRVEVEVDDGCTLEIEDVGGTVAYESTGEPSRFDVAVTLGRDAQLLWRAHPFVVAAGADVDRQTVIDLGEDSSVLLRETLVLGRSGERGGRIRSGLHARVQTADAAAYPLLHEELALDGAAGRVGVLGEHRVLDSAILLGRRPPGATRPEGVTVLELDGPGAMARRVADATHGTGIDAVMEAWAPRVDPA